jgi:hypothetical protein
MLLVAGCSAVENPFSALQTKRTITPKTEIINIGKGHLSVPPPPGFCKDASGSKSNKISAFIIFANCGYLNSGGKQPTEGSSFSGLVTANVATEPALHNTEDINEISEFLSSREGLETLSSSGKADSISIVDKRQSSEGVYLQLHDKQAALSQNIWKGFLKRSNHLVTVTLLQNQHSFLSAEQTMQFLQSYSETIEVNANTPEPLSIGQHISTEQVKTEEEPLGQVSKLKNVGILRRLLL